MGIVFVKEGSSPNIKVGPFVDSTDGNTVESGLTITQPDILLSKNGGTLTQKNAAQTLTHDANGYYTVALNATDTNTLGHMLLSIHESGALSVREDIIVMPANVWDSWFSTDKLQVDVVEMASAVLTATAIATDALGAAEISAAAANKIADHVLRRTYANARASSDGDTLNFRSLLGAVGKLVNKWSISGSTLTIFQEDDATSTAPGGTQTITSSASAEAITGLDP